MTSNATCLTGLASALLLTTVASAQAVPLPEFYGIYLVDGGKLHGVDVPVSTLTPPHEKIVISHTEKELERGNANGVDVPVLSTSADILVFVKTDSLGIASRLKLRSLSFIEKMTVNDALPAYRKTYQTYAWVAATDIGYLGVGEAILNFLYKPVKGEDEMVLAVPTPPLTPGLYRLQLESGDLDFYFVVGPLSEARGERCIEATLPKAFGDWRTLPCGTSSPTPAEGGEPLEQASRDARGAPNRQWPVASSAEGVARFPAGRVSADTILDTFRKAMIDAGYTLESEGRDRIASFLFADEHDALVKRLSRDLGAPIRFTWSVATHPLESGAVEVTMTRTTNLGSQTFTDIPPLFKYACQKLGLDPSTIRLAAGGREDRLSAWK